MFDKNCFFGIMVTEWVKYPIRFRENALYGCGDMGDKGVKFSGGVYEEKEGIYIN